MEFFIFIALAAIAGILQGIRMELKEITKALNYPMKDNSGSGPGG